MPNGPVGAVGSSLGLVHHRKTCGFFSGVHECYLTLHGDTQCLARRLLGFPLQPGHWSKPRDPATTRTVSRTASAHSAACSGVLLMGRLCDTRSPGLQKVANGLNRKLPISSYHSQHNPNQVSRSVLTVCGKAKQTLKRTLAVSGLQTHTSPMAAHAYATLCLTR